MYSGDPLGVKFYLYLQRWDGNVGLPLSSMICVNLEVFRVDFIYPLHDDNDI
jgi:hypothetical protein